MGPNILKILLVQPVNTLGNWCGMDLWGSQQRRSRRDEETNTILHRVYTVDKPILLDQIEHLTVVLQRGPRREGDQRGAKGDTGRLKDVLSGEDVWARVPFFQMREYDFAKGLHSRNDKNATKLTEFFEEGAVFEDMFNFGGEIESQIGKLFMHGSNDVEGVARAIEKVWIP
jgi:hypothetical protein